MQYKNELKFVIPHFREINYEVIEIDYMELKKRVLYELDLVGLNYYMILPVKEVIEGVEYDAEMVIVYCGEEFESVFIEIFEKLSYECCREWEIDFFSYVHNGVLVTIEKENL